MVMAGVPSRSVGLVPRGAWARAIGLFVVLGGSACGRVGYEDLGRPDTSLPEDAATDGEAQDASDAAPPDDAGCRAALRPLTAANGTAEHADVVYVPSAVRTLVAYDHAVEGVREIAQRTLDDQGQLGAEIAVTPSVVLPQTRPSVHRGLTTIGSAWLSFDATTHSVYFRELSATGAPFGVAGTQISPNLESVVSGSRPSMTYDGADWRVAWARTAMTGVRVARVPPGFGAISVATVATSVVPGFPQISKTASGFVIAYTTASSVTFVRTNDALGVLHTTQLASGDTYGAPSVATRDDEVAVVWSEASAGADRVRLARVSPTNVVTTMDVEVVSGTATAPHIARNGAAWVLVWSDARFGQAEVFLSRRTDAGAAIGEAERLTTTTPASVEPRVVRAADAFVVVHTEVDAGGSSVVLTSPCTVP